MSVVWTIIILSVLIVVHEFGHFLLARLNGVRVEEFALGMGPKIIGRFSKKGTFFAWRLFPIGGYCKMSGEDGGEGDDEAAFYNKSVPRRISIIVAGPLMNFVLAFVLFIFAFMGMGVPSDAPIIGRVMDGYPAAVAGIEDGDKILAVAGIDISTWQQAIEIIQQEGKEGEPLSLLLERDGESFSLDVSPEIIGDNARPMLGIEQSIEKANLWGSIKLGLYNTYSFTKQILMAFVYMFTGQVEVELAGPVGMAGIVGTVASSGMLNLLVLAGIISINLGIINLLPLPALDGGRVVFMIIEGIRGKAIDPDKEAMVHFIGIMALFALMILVTYQDIVKLIAQ